MVLVLLALKNLKYRIKKNRACFEHMSGNILCLDRERIYAIYASNSGAYAVYDTDKPDYYSPYLAEKLPADAKLVADIYTATGYRCPKCGSPSVEVDDDYGVCNVCNYFGSASEFTVFEQLYKPKKFYVKDILTGEATDNNCAETPRDVIIRILSRRPSWSDGVYIASPNIAIPVKKSMYGNGYYYKRTWRPLRIPEYADCIEKHGLMGKLYISDTKRGVIQHRVKISNKGSKYIILEVIDNEKQNKVV